MRRPRATEPARRPLRRQHCFDVHELVDRFARLAVGVDELPEPFRHLAAFTLVMLCVMVMWIAVGMTGYLIAALTRGSGWAHRHTSFEDMLSHCARLARVSWWAAWPESLVRSSPPKEDLQSSWHHLPDAQVTWAGSVFRASHPYVTVAEVLWSGLQSVLRPSRVTVFVWIVVIVFLDGDELSRLASDEFVDTVQANGALLPGLITLMLAVLAILLAFRPRARALAAHRLEVEKACLSALSRVRDNLRIAGQELWRIGTHDAAPNARHELGRSIRAVSGGACELDWELVRVELVRWPTRWIPDTEPPPPNLERLRAAAEAIETERELLDQRGQIATLWNLLGPAAWMRTYPLLRASRSLKSAADPVSSDAVRALIESSWRLDSAGRDFEQAQRAHAPQVRAETEVRGAIQLELAKREIVYSYRREWAKLARQVAEIDELYFRLGRRLRLGKIERALMH